MNASMMRNMPILCGIHRQSERCSVEIRNMPIVWGVQRQSERCSVENKEHADCVGRPETIRTLRAQKPHTFPFCRGIDGEIARKWARNHRTFPF